MHPRLLLPSIILYFLLVIATACSSSSSTHNNGNNHQVSPRAYHVESLQIAPFYINTEKYSGWNIRGTSSPEGVPLIKLNSGQKISVSFLYLDTDAKQYKTNLVHYTLDWEPSNVPQSRYLDGTFEDYFGGGRPSANTNVTYRKYSYEFPTERQRPNVSGNYMIEIRDYDTNELVARLPFLVHEQTGVLTTQRETLYNAGPKGEPRYQPFSRYNYPDWIEMPRFDLSFRYLPLPFWGQQRKVNIVDYLDDGEARFHLSRPESFTATLIRSINLQNPRPDGTRIDEVQTPAGAQPIQVLLDPDEVTLEEPNRVPRPTLFGHQQSERSIQMLDVTFRLLNPESGSSQKVYLVGNFNGWQLPTDPMRFNPNSGFWEQTIRVPEGVYQYQYMRQVNGELEPIVGAYSYADIPTPFSTQIYYKDPELYLFRLLQVGVITSN